MTYLTNSPRSLRSLSGRKVSLSRPQNCGSWWTSLRLGMTMEWAGMVNPDTVTASLVQCCTPSGTWLVYRCTSSIKARVRGVRAWS